MTRSTILWIVSIVVALISAGCGHVLYSDGPYHGKVIDRETRQPIEGAAVLAVWWKETPMIAEAQVTYYDAQNATTGSEGNFTIPGITGGSINPTAKIKEPLFTIFKPGYEAYKARRLPVSGRNDKSMIELNSLANRSRQERIRNLDLLLPRECDSSITANCIPQEKLLPLLTLLNFEEKGLGLQPTYLQK